MNDIDQIQESWNLSSGGNKLVLTQNPQKAKKLEASGSSEGRGEGQVELKIELIPSLNIVRAQISFLPVTCPAFHYPKAKSLFFSDVEVQRIWTQVYL